MSAARYPLYLARAVVPVAVVVVVVAVVVLDERSRRDTRTKK